MDLLDFTWLLILAGAIALVVASVVVLRDQKKSG